MDLQPPLEPVPGGHALPITTSDDLRRDEPVNCVGAGRTAEAREAVAQLQKLQPDFRASYVYEAFPIRSSDERDRIASALRGVGLPD
jgi:hypothetical protein